MGWAIKAKTCEHCILGGNMQVGSVVRDITGVIGLVVEISVNEIDFVVTTFGSVRRENLEVICK
tara:strand:+ start:350 stop:541 length:192 start_codon:yes stop_codon:yes gene_type:complete